jgi:toxin ParE1/3/4
VPKYRVEITRVAESDIMDIFRHIASDNPTAADHWVNEIEKQIDSLEKFPARCPVVPETRDLGKEYRHILYGNYRTIFRMEGLRVIIMRVIHDARLFDLNVIQK